MKATEGGDLEGGRGTHGTGTAKSLEEWRKILAVRYQCSAFFQRIWSVAIISVDTHSRAGTSMRLPCILLNRAPCAVASVKSTWEQHSLDVIDFVVSRHSFFV
jgi:hypothetical protein